MPRLRRVSASAPGFGRRRAGRGWVYLDVDGVPLRDEAALARCRRLAIPPAWREVWICRYPDGHLQAFGRDDAGRGQYLYHEEWTQRRRRRKHDHVLEVAARLPAARRRVARALAEPGLGPLRVAALAFRLLDLAYFRAGGEIYATKHRSFGLATIRKEHVVVGAEGTVRFRYPAKSGQIREVEVDDPVVAELVAAMKRRRGGTDLLAWRNGDGSWHDVTSADVQAAVKEQLGPEATPKDFRTWHATVLAARALADAGLPPRSDRARRHVVAGVVRDVAEELGNTPAVARASYIDPRLVDLWEHGETIGPTRTHAAAERAVLRLLGG
ncbi:putative viral-like DNA topoisomerase [Xylanimonas cellulosilytica DSM 15894]|uniref:DNA topoisomerase n=1 Tax=Xylanimonas cellulosilytica (strain DSM 15894 / JCM 12276 / CECT 5975 / KCTC 9989 / LMG 20990 / NBRC 107835 / XIL07) TaxID=446471 RepID=D1BZH3_XYLCX|nr:DNA topoisomerase IB [Xylanimonas cellulosilytica]ACZ30127.1 putative viral-like DNA topoisomerase [Xylanimonas cellulosilytica DSM 15894]